MRQETDDDDDDDGGVADLLLHITNGAVFRIFIPATTLCHYVPKKKSSSGCLFNINPKQSGYFFDSCQLSSVK